MKMTFECDQFILNAWKKDFCSNCFKSRIEHRTVSKSRLNCVPNANPNPNPNVQLRSQQNLIKPKDQHSVNGKRKVSFSNQLVQIIGTGGDEYFDYQFEFSDVDGYDDDIDSYGDGYDGAIDNDEGSDPDLRKITKINTDYNSGRKDILSLGAQLSTPDKKPLEISITPFGSSSTDLEMQEKKKSVSLNRNCAFIREKPMTYQAKNFKINYLTKPKEDFSNSINSPQFSNEIVTSVPPIQIVESSDDQQEVNSEQNDDSKRTEVDELSSMSSIEDLPPQNVSEKDSIHDDNMDRNSDQQTIDTDSLKIDSDDSLTQAAESNIQSETISVPVPCKRKAPSPPKSIPHETIDDVIVNDAVTIDKKLLNKKFGKVFLKRFLKLGKGLDFHYNYGIDSHADSVAMKPKPKPRLTIVHPSDLNGVNVQVVKNSKIDEKEDNSEIKMARPEMPSPPPRKPQRCSHSRPPKPDEKLSVCEEDDDKLLQTGSESDSEIYTQYSFCSSENETSGFIDDDDDVESGSRRSKDEFSKPEELQHQKDPQSIPQPQPQLQPRTCNQLRSNKGRSIIHRSLEDNYGAIIVANHEALVNALDNMCTYPCLPASLKLLTSVNKLNFKDFSVMDTQKSILGNCAFLQAIYTRNQQKVTLMMSQQPPTSILTLGSSSSIVTLASIVEFSDEVQATYLNDNDNRDLRQMKISVLPPIETFSLVQYEKQLLSRRDFNEILFLMLQLINVLKILQAHEIEKVSETLQEFILCRQECFSDQFFENDDELILPKLIILPNCLNDGNEDKPMKSLCESATSTLNRILPDTHHIKSQLITILEKEHSSSLTQAKSLLEYYLWGPSDISLSPNCQKERELILKRWLDLERATVLQSLVQNKRHLSTVDQFHLMFLVRTNPKIISEASGLLDCK